MKALGTWLRELLVLRELLLPELELLDILFELHSWDEKQLAD